MCQGCQTYNCPQCGFVKDYLRYCPACDWDCEDEYSNNNDYYEDEYYDEDED